jgi:DnaJ-class molecular chaperone
MLACDQGDFDTPEDAAAFAASLCPTCEGFGEVLLDAEHDSYETCADCDGSGQRFKAK